MTGDKRILFLMALRNRRERAIRSVKSIAESSLKDHFECVIVQDFDTDNVTDADFENVGIPVSVVNQKIGGLFYKTRLLNFGIAITTNEIIVQQDADILFQEPFLKALVHLSQNQKPFQKYFFGTPYLESEDMDVPAVNVTERKTRKKGDYLGDTFIFLRSQFETVRGYDERMRMWHEEEDIANRILRQFSLAYYDIGAVGIQNLHMTHGNNLRSFSNEERIKNLALFHENNARKINILPGQLPGNIQKAIYFGKDFFFRNNEGDLTALRENSERNTYMLDSVVVPHGGIILDIGAHIGTFALAMPERIREIMCYEPDTANVLLLEKNTALSGKKNITIHKKAVASHTGMIDLHVHPELTVLNSPLSKDNSFFTERVASVSLVDVIGNRYIDLLKIDCEGGEYDIFYNSPKEIFKKINYIVMEYHNMEKKDSRYTGKALTSYLTQNGFVIIKENAEYDQKGKTGIVVLKNEAAKRYTRIWNEKFIKNVETLQMKPSELCLEIGSFEGLTSNYIFEHLLSKTGKLICVDPLSDQYLTEDISLGDFQKDNAAYVSFEGQYDRFVYNTKEICDTGRVELCRKTSREAYPELKKRYEGRFDFVYIDGDHRTEAVYFDAIHSFDLCKKGGIILFDDYLWEDSEKKRITKIGIDRFLAEYEGKYEIVLQNYQIAIRKL